MPDAAIRSLFLLFMAFFFRVFFRREWLAVIGIAIATFAFESRQTRRHSFDFCSLYRGYDGADRIPIHTSRTAGI